MTCTTEDFQIYKNFVSIASPGVLFDKEEPFVVHSSPEKNFSPFNGFILGKNFIPTESILTVTNVQSTIFWEYHRQYQKNKEPFRLQIYYYMV